MSLDLRLRPLVAVTLAALLVAACGEEEDAGEAVESASVVTEALAEDVSESTGGEVEQPADETSTAPAGAVVVDHAMGSTEVLADPQRVVVLDTPHLDTALALGVTPVGAVQSSVAEGLPGYLGERAEGIEIVGTIEEPDLEAIAELEPDLILSAKVRHEQIYDQLSELAPTVFTDYQAGWEPNFVLISDALGLDPEGEQALADYHERAEAIGAEVGADGLSAAIVRFLPDETRIYGPDTFSGDVLTDVGFTLPELDFDEYSMAYISPEQVQLLGDAEVIFSTTYGDPVATTQDAVTAVWGTVPAVEAGCQFAVEDDEWMLGIGLIGAGIILDDVESLLSGAGCGE